MKPVIVILFGLLSVVAVAQQRKPPDKVNPAAKASNVPDNSKPEPSGVYGYITVIDPTNGHKYAGPGGPSSGTGLAFPANVVFRRKLDITQTYTVNFESFGCSYYGNPPVACWYVFRFTQDNDTVSVPFNGTDNTIHYNPNQWRFLRVEMGPLRWDEQQSLSASAPPVHVTVPIAQANSPFSDLPDFHASFYGPSS